MTAVAIDPVALFDDCRWTHRHPDNVEPVLRLSPRDVLLLQWAADGLEVSQMAALSGRSRHAVENYWKRMCTHLKVPTRAAAVAKALRAGVIQ